MVFAAASLTNALEELGGQFMDETEVKVIFHFGGSNALARQILMDGPADLFISAGAQPMDLVDQTGLLREDTRVDLLTNSLVLVGPANEPDKLKSLKELKSHGARMVIADPDLAPAGYYAREALKALNLWDDLLPNLVFATDVRTALSYVKMGNVDAGIVYRTDIMANEGFRIISSLPRASYPTVLYAGGVTLSASPSIYAEKFLSFLTSREAYQVYHKYGFEALPPQ